MARVFIDPHMFSLKWFADAIVDLLASQAVTFVYANCEQGNTEVSRVRKALEFFKVVRALKNSSGGSRGEVPPIDQIEKHRIAMINHATFAQCQDCDDPHIFAVVYVKPTRYIFSEDARIASCRDVIRSTVDKRYCKFILVSTKPVYDQHKQAILA